MLPEVVALMLIAAGEFSSPVAAPVEDAVLIPPIVIVADEDEKAPEVLPWVDEAHEEEQHHLRLDADALGIIAAWKGDVMVIDMTGDPNSDEYKRADAFLSGYVLADARTDQEDGCECLYYPGLTIEVLN